MSKEAPQALQEQAQVLLPRIIITYCTQCKWMLRAAYVGLSLFNPQIELHALNFTFYEVSYVHICDDRSHSKIQGSPKELDLVASLDKIILSYISLLSKLTSDHFFDICSSLKSSSPLSPFPSVKSLLDPPQEVSSPSILSILPILLQLLHTRPQPLPPKAAARRLRSEYGILKRSVHFLVSLNFLSALFYICVCVSRELYHETCM